MKNKTGTATMIVIAIAMVLAAKCSFLGNTLEAIHFLLIVLILQNSEKSSE
jgi:hypothetical protein